MSELDRFNHPVVSQAWAEYLAETQGARDVYDQALNAAKTDRDSAYAHAHADHQIAFDKAWEAYNHAVTEAWREYHQATDQARKARDYQISTASETELLA